MFVAGVISQLGLVRKLVGSEIKERPPITSVWINNGSYSFDRGETWTKNAPPHGCKVERVFATDGVRYMHNPYRETMPTYYANEGVAFDGVGQCMVSPYGIGMESFREVYFEFQ